MGEARRARLGVALLLLGAAGCAATTTSGAGVGTVARRGAAIGYDFGDARAGDRIAHRFTITNPSNRTLLIRNARSSCGCIAKIESARSIAPGSAGEVAVVLDTEGKSGPTAAAVRLETDDPARGDLTLLLHGRVVADVAASPQHLYLGRVAPNRRASAHVDIRLAPGVELRSAKSEDGWIEVKARPLPPPQSGARLDLTLNPVATRGRINDRILVATTSARQPVLGVPVYASIE